MPTKNYTSKVDIYQSLGEIQGALARHGACKIMVDYDGAGRPMALTFGILTQQGAVGYHLPVNVDGVLGAFAREKIKVDREQAERTAWRNIRDWVLAQMAFVESGGVQMDEVFLPYMADRRGRTLYQVYKSGQLALPDGGDDSGEGGEKQHEDQLSESGYDGVRNGLSRATCTEGSAGVARGRNFI